MIAAVAAVVLTHAMARGAGKPLEHLRGDGLTP